MYSKSGSAPAVAVRQMNGSTVVTCNRPSASTAASLAPAVILPASVAMADTVHSQVLAPAVQPASTASSTAAVASAACSVNTSSARPASSATPPVSVAIKPESDDVPTDAAVVADPGQTGTAQGDRSDDQPVPGPSGQATNDHTAPTLGKQNDAVQFWLSKK